MPRFYIALFTVSLLICSFASNSSAGTPQIRVTITVEGHDTTDTAMVSALSREFRRLDGVLVTDTQPDFKVSCVIAPATAGRGKIRAGYAASTAVTDVDDHLFTHMVDLGDSIDGLAHAIAIAIDGSLIEPKRRAGQPSSSP